jgi:membrane fusion protein (multidrug efflux system)
MEQREWKCPMYLPRTLWHARAAVTLAAIALAGCGQAKSTAPVPQTPEVAVVTVHRESVPVSIELPGRTSPYLIAQVHARVDGIVQKRTYQEGDDVKANQLLYQIDPTPYRAILDSAEATLQKAQANLANTTVQMERYKILVGGNAISKQVYDNAVAAQRQAAADVAVAKAAVETAKINLGYTSVTSPIAGQSNISLVTQGAYVQANAATLMTTVQQIDPIYVDLKQSSVEGLQLRHAMENGQIKANGPHQAKVSLLLEDGTRYPLPGTLEFSNTTVDPATGSVTVRARFPNPTHILLPGMFVRASVEQGTNDNVVPVPVSAVTHNPQGAATVLVVGPDHKIALRTIQAKRMVGDNWVAEAGLNDGEQIVVSGRQKAQPGMVVKVVEAQSPGAPAAKSDATAKTVVASEAK